MKEQPNGVTVSAFGAAAGVSVETIRFYQRKGLLPRPKRSYGSVRRYGPADVARVRFVKSAQALGFTLEQVASLLSLEDGNNCGNARSVAEQKLDEVRGKLRDLQRMETALEGLVNACSASRGSVACPLIAALYEPSGEQAT